LAKDIIEDGNVYRNYIHMLNALLLKHIHFCDE